MGREAPQQTIALYVGYTANNLRVGAEYNYQLNHKMNAAEDLTGISFMDPTN